MLTLSLWLHLPAKLLTWLQAVIQLLCRTVASNSVFANRCRCNCVISVIICLERLCFMCHAENIQDLYSVHRRVLCHMNFIHSGRENCRYVSIKMHLLETRQFRGNSCTSAKVSMLTWGGISGDMIKAYFAKLQHLWTEVEPEVLLSTCFCCCIAPLSGNTVVFYGLFKKILFLWWKPVLWCHYTELCLFLTTGSQGDMRKIKSSRG